MPEQSPKAIRPDSGISPFTLTDSPNPPEPRPNRPGLSRYDRTLSIEAHSPRGFHPAVPGETLELSTHRGGLARGARSENRGFYYLRLRQSTGAEKAPDRTATLFQSNHSTVSYPHVGGRVL